MKPNNVQWLCLVTRQHKTKSSDWFFCFISRCRKYVLGIRTCLFIYLFVIHALSVTSNLTKTQWAVRCIHFIGHASINQNRFLMYTVILTCHSRKSTGVNLWCSNKSQKINGAKWSSAFLPATCRNMCLFLTTDLLGFPFLWASIYIWQIHINPNLVS